MKKWIFKEIFKVGLIDCPSLSLSLSTLSTLSLSLPFLSSLPGMANGKKEQPVANSSPNGNVSNAHGPWGYHDRRAMHTSTESATATKPQRGRPPRQRASAYSPGDPNGSSTSNHPGMGQTQYSQDEKVNWVVKETVQHNMQGLWTCERSF